jgi:hypothetical protein
VTREGGLPGDKRRHVAILRMIGDSARFDANHAVSNHAEMTRYPTPELPLVC